LKRKNLVCTVHMQKRGLDLIGVVSHCLTEVSGELSHAKPRSGWLKSIRQARLEQAGLEQAAPECPDNKTEVSSSRLSLQPPRQSILGYRALIPNSQLYPHHPTL
jgi:hypothetical protein